MEDDQYDPIMEDKSVDFTSQLFALPVFKTHQPPISPEAPSIVRAASQGDTESLASLMNCKLDPTASPVRLKKKLARETCSRTGFTAFLAAVSSGNLAAVQMMVAQCGAQLNQTDRQGRTAFHLAAQGNYKEIFAFLLTLLRPISETCCPANSLLALDHNNRSVLHYSCFTGALSITRLLLDRLDSRWLSLQTDKQGLNPIQLAVSRKHDGCLELLLESRHALHKTLCTMLEDGSSVPFFSPSIQSELDALSAIGRSSSQPKQFVTDYLLRHFERAQDTRGRSVLHLAIQNEAEEMVEFLLEEGVDLSLSDTGGRTAFHYAVRVNSHAILSLLLERVQGNSAIIKQADNEGWTAAQWACLLDHDRCLQALLINQARALSQTQPGSLLEIAQKILFQETLHKPTGRLLLHWAARLSSLRCCRLLFSPRLFLHLQGFSESQISLIDDAVRFRQMEARDESGRTPFFYACCPVELPDAVFVNVAASLTSQASSVSLPGTPIRSSRRRSSLATAQSAENKEKTVVKEGMATARVAHSTEVVDLFISRGADVRHLDSLGRTVLHYVAFSGRLKIAQLLIGVYQKAQEMQPGQSVSEINTVVHDAKGYSALHAAAAGGHNELCRLLVLQGGYGSRIDVETFGPKHRTPIQEALIHGHVETFRLLLDLEANVFQQDIHGWSLSSLALVHHQRSRPELCKQFLTAMFDFCSQLPRPTAHKLLRQISSWESAVMDANHRELLIDFMGTHPAVALMLLPNQQNKISALHLSCLMSPTDQLRQLLQPFERFCLFARKRFAASMPPICSVLLDSKGHSGLHFALSRSDLDASLLDVLLNAGYTNPPHSAQQASDIPDTEHTRRTMPLFHVEHVPFSDLKSSTLQTLLTNRHLKGKMLSSLVQKIFTSQQGRLGDSGLRRLLTHRDQRGRNVLHSVMSRSYPKTIRTFVVISTQLNAFEEFVGNRDYAGRSVHDDFASKADLLALLQKPVKFVVAPPTQTDIADPSPFSKHLQHVAQLVQNLQIEPSAMAIAFQPQPQPQSLPHIPFKRSGDNPLFDESQDKEVQRYLSSSTVSRPTKRPKAVIVPANPVRTLLSANLVFQRSIVSAPAPRPSHHAGLNSKMTTGTLHSSKASSAAPLIKMPKPTNATTVVPTRPTKTVSVKPSIPVTRMAERKPTDDVRPSVRSAKIITNSSSSSSSVAPEVKRAVPAVPKPMITTTSAAATTRVVEQRPAALRDIQPKQTTSVVASSVVAKSRDPVVVAGSRASKTVAPKGSGAENRATKAPRTSVFDRLAQDASMRAERRKQTILK